MRSLRISAFILSALLAPLLQPGSARAEQPALGPAYEWIEPTGAFDVFDVGFKPSPTPDAAEFKDAMAQFSDPKDAQAALSKLSKGRGAERPFVIFRIAGGNGPNSDALNMLCGVGPQGVKDPQQIIETSSIFTGDPTGLTSYANFKKAPRADRVRTIARCLHSLPGMPSLKPAPRPALKHLYIDAPSYAAAEHWLRSFDPAGFRGSHDQYNDAFKCLLTHVAADETEATGDALTFRSFHYTRTTVTPAKADWTDSKAYQAPDYDSTKEHAYVLSVVQDGPAVHDQFSGSDLNDLTGPWTTRAGFDSPGLIIDGEANPIAQALGISGKKYLHECRSRAGLFEMPPSRPPELGAASADCPH